MSSKMSTRKSNKRKVVDTSYFSDSDDSYTEPTPKPKRRSKGKGKVGRPRSTKAAVAAAGRNRSVAKGRLCSIPGCTKQGKKSVEKKGHMCVWHLEIDFAIV